MEIEQVVTLEGIEADRMDLIAIHGERNALCLGLSGDETSIVHRLPRPEVEKLRDALTEWLTQ